MIGAGRIGAGAGSAEVEAGAAHAQAYRSHPRTRLVAVADVEEARRTEARAKLGITAYSDATSLCAAEKPDIVSICTPSATHAAVAQEVLANAPPRLIFVEKPLATSVADGEAVLDAARRAGTAIAVNYTRRYLPTFRAVAAEVLAGRHGAAVYARITYANGLANNGGHAIDLLRSLFGEITSALGRPASWAAAGPGDDAMYDAEISIEGGARARLEAFDARVASIFEGDLFFERTRFRFTVSGARWEIFERREGALAAGYTHFVPTQRADVDPTFRDALADPLHHAVDALTRHLDARDPLPCTGDDGLAVLRVIEAIRPVT